MPAVFKIFKKTMADLKPLCGMIAAKIYDPIIAGRPLPDLREITIGISLEEMLQGLDTVAAK
jgi:hypothetical protein